MIEMPPAARLRIVPAADAPAEEPPADEIEREVEVLAPAAAAALRLLADAVRRRHTDPETVVQALKNARVNTAFAEVLDAASDVVMAGLEDPYEFDGRLRAENLSGAASQVRDAFHWL
ncbi:hypothetical protein [Streptomyces jumonjinensis]|uniref:hypothetical protein n=1 Tax=Streptomyces jumonjinensis TaxID=1945 RepID=UPI00378E8371